MVNATYRLPTIQPLVFFYFSGLSDLIRRCRQRVKLSRTGSRKLSRIRRRNGGGEGSRTGKERARNGRAALHREKLDDIMSCCWSLL